MPRRTLRALRYALAGLALMADLLGVATAQADAPEATDYLGQKSPVAFANQPALPVGGSAVGASTGPSGANVGGSTSATGLGALRNQIASGAIPGPNDFSNPDVGGGEGPGGSGATGTGDLGAASGAFAGGIPSPSLSNIARGLGLELGQVPSAVLDAVAGKLGLSPLSLLGKIAPGLAPALGPVGLGISGFNTLVSISNALADAMGIPSNQTIATLNPTIDQDINALELGSIGAKGIDAQNQADVAAFSQALASNNIDLAMSIFSNNPALARAFGGYDSGVHSNPTGPNTPGYGHFGPPRGPTAAGPNTFNTDTFTSTNFSSNPSPSTAPQGAIFSDAPPSQFSGARASAPAPTGPPAPSITPTIDDALDYSGNVPTGQPGAPPGIDAPSVDAAGEL